MKYDGYVRRKAMRTNIDCRILLELNVNVKFRITGSLHVSVTYGGFTKLTSTAPRIEDRDLLLKDTLDNTTIANYTHSLHFPSAPWGLICST